MSGSVLGRRDLQIEVPALTSDELLRASPADASAVMRARVLAARARQRERGVLNALLGGGALRQHCALDAATRRLATVTVARGGMSARAVHRALRVARVIADLAGEEQISVRALAEALQYQAHEARRFIKERG